MVYFCATSELILDHIYILYFSLQILVGFYPRHRGLIQNEKNSSTLAPVNLFMPNSLNNRNKIPLPNSYAPPDAYMVLHEKPRAEISTFVKVGPGLIKSHKVDSLREQLSDTPFFNPLKSKNYSTLEFAFIKRRFWPMQRTPLPPFGEQVKIMFDLHKRKNIIRLLSAAYTTERTFNALVGIRVIARAGQILRASTLVPWVYRAALRHPKYTDNMGLSSSPATSIYDMNAPFISWEDWDRHVKKNRGNQVR